MRVVSALRGEVVNPAERCNRPSGKETLPERELTDAELVFRLLFDLLRAGRRFGLGIAVQAIFERSPPLTSSVHVRMPLVPNSASDAAGP